MVLGIGQDPIAIETYQLNIITLEPMQGFPERPVLYHSYETRKC